MKKSKKTVRPGLRFGILAVLIGLLPQTVFAVNNYVFKLGTVNTAAKTATLILEYPAHVSSRDVFLTYTDKVAISGADNGATQTVTKTVPTVRVPKETGSQNFNLTGLSGGDHSATVTVKEPGGAQLFTQVFDFAVGSATGGTCSITTRIDASKTKAYLTYDMPPYGSGNTPRTLTVTLDGSTNQTIDYQGLLAAGGSRITVSLTGLSAIKHTGNMRLVDSAPICSNDFTIDLTDPNNPDGGSGGPGGPGITPNAGTPTGGRVPGTWLSGECISKAENLDLDAFRCVLQNSFDFLLDFLGVVATGLVVYGGFVLLSSTDDEGRKKGKAIITKALIGLVVVLLAYVVVQLVLGGGIF